MQDPKRGGSPLHDRQPQKAAFPAPARAGRPATSVIWLDLILPLLVVVVVIIAVTRL